MPCADRKARTAATPSFTSDDSTPPRASIQALKQAAAARIASPGGQGTTSSPAAISPGRGNDAETAGDALHLAVRLGRAVVRHEVGDAALDGLA